MIHGLGRLLVVWLVVSTVGLAGPASAGQPTPSEAALWREMLDRLDAGTQIAVRLKTGARRRGIVLRVGDESFTFKPYTRIPVEAREIRFSEVANIELQQPSMSPGKKVLLGVGIGAGVYLVLTALLFAAIGYD